MIQYEALVEFHKIHGHCHVPKNPPRERCIGGAQHKLALWVNRQRKAHEKNTLSSERKELLDNLNFYWNPNDYVWDQHYREVKALWQEHGHANVPFSTKSINDSNRCYQQHMAWAKEQRIQHLLREQDKHTMMSDWRKQKLDAIAFVWKPDDEEELKSLEKNADTKDCKWCFRRIPNYEWARVLAAIKHAKAECERTGKDTVVLLEDHYGLQVVTKETDGTLLCVAVDSDFNPDEHPNVVGFKGRVSES